MNIRIQDGTVSVFGSDHELENASAVDKAVFDAIISAISSAMHTPTIKNHNEHIETRSYGEEELDEERGKENREQNREEELKKAFEEMFGVMLGVAILSKFAKYDNTEEEIAKLKENFWR
jgi:hypothetical protein